MFGPHPLVCQRCTSDGRSCSFFLPFQVVIIIDQTDILFCWRKSKNSHWDQRLSGWSDIIRFRFTSVSSVFQTKRRSSGRCPWLPCDRQTDLYEIGRLSILLREATGITVGGVTSFVLVFHTTSGNTVRLFIITVCNCDRLSSIYLGMNHLLIQALKNPHPSPVPRPSLRELQGFAVTNRPPSLQHFTPLMKCHLNVTTALIGGK